jgi:predicted acyltransferase
VEEAHSNLRWALRLAIVAIVLSILLLAALLLALGVRNVASGLGDGAESPQLNLMVGLIATSLGLLLAAVGITLPFIAVRRTM